MKNIGFVSTRIAGNDGVSLEIGKWASVLRSMGYGCFYFSGLNDRPRQVSFSCKEAWFQNEGVLSVGRGVFGVTQRSSAISGLERSLRESIRQGLYQFVSQYDIDMLIAENAMSIPMNLPLGLALADFIEETGMPVIAHHHDFFWERDRFILNAAGDWLERAFPPALPGVTHVVINTLAAKELESRRGLTGTVIPNVLDFYVKPGKPEADVTGRIREIAGAARGDPLILQPTRIIPRKRIEKSIELVRRMNMKKPLLAVSHPSGDEGGEYLEYINDLADEKGVLIAYLDDEEKTGGDCGDILTLENIYGAADLVLFPSAWEGFGNALLEAIYYGKPVVTARYPVFVADIEPKGFRLILMENDITTDIIHRVREVLENDFEREALAAHNYRVAQEYFSCQVLEKSLQALMEKFG